MRQSTRNLTKGVLLGGAAALAPVAAQADTIIVPVNVTVTAASSPFSLQVGSDPSQDLIFSINGGGCDLCIDTSGGVEYVVNGGLPSNLSFGSVIGPGSTFGTGLGNMVTKTTFLPDTPTWSGNFNPEGKDGNLGFEFPVNSSVDYGYVSLTSSDFEGQSIDIQSFTYDNTGASVTVTPEPSTLPILALGALGIEILRRRRAVLAANKS